MWEYYFKNWLIKYFTEFLITNVLIHTLFEVAEVVLLWKLHNLCADNELVNIWAFNQSYYAAVD